MGRLASPSRKNGNGLGNRYSIVEKKRHSAPMNAIRSRRRLSALFIDRPCDQERDIVATAAFERELQRGTRGVLEIDGRVIRRDITAILLVAPDDGAQNVGDPAYIRVVGE